MLFLSLLSAANADGQFFSMNLFGRRRVEIGDAYKQERAEMDAFLCDTIHSHLTSSDLRSKLLIQEAETDGSSNGEISITAEDIAEDVFQHCKDLAAAAPPSEFYTGPIEAPEKAEGFDQWYLDLLVEAAGNDVDRRREEIQLDEVWFRQCQGYALMTAELLKKHFVQGAAAMASTNTGSPIERIAGCGAIVNSVNSAIKNDKIPGVYVDGGQVVTKDPDVARLFLGTAAVAVTGIFTLFSTCTSYAALALA